MGGGGIHLDDTKRIGRRMIDTLYDHLRLDRELILPLYIPFDKVVELIFIKFCSSLGLPDS